jgi:polyisoprenoid-binding protein YceI
MKQLVLLFALLTSQAALAGAEYYSIDSSHAFANFTIRHVVSKTSGTFPGISGKILIDRSDLAKSSIVARINVLSVNTNHAMRDTRIREKAEYLDAGKFGWIDFTSTKIEPSAIDAGMITGNLTMHGVTKEISFPFHVLGFGKDPFGLSRVGFEAHTILKASDYGYGWASQPDGPIGNEIEITLLIEGIKSSPEIKPGQQNE